MLGKFEHGLFLRNSHCLGMLTRYRVYITKNNELNNPAHDFCDELRLMWLRETNLQGLRLEYHASSHQVHIYNPILQGSRFKMSQ